MQTPEQKVVSNRRYYLKNKNKVLNRNKETKRKCQDHIRIIKETTPCKDCGKSFPACAMDFDHLRDKKINISRMAVRVGSIAKINEEIAKCEVVCAVCHRIRSFNRKYKKN